MSQTLLNQSKYNSPKHLVYIHPDSNFGMFTFHTLKIINQCEVSRPRYKNARLVSADKKGNTICDFNIYDISARLDFFFNGPQQAKKSQKKKSLLEPVGLQQHDFPA